MKKIKKINPNSNNSNKQKDDSHLDFCETENPSKKRKTLNLKNPKKLIKNPINEPNNDIDSQNQDFIFKGIGEKDPSLSQINTDELEYPFWLKPENIKDIQGRSFHNDGNYDPSTLLIPEKEIKKQSAVFKQYWAIKSKNFDKIVFFRLGLPFYCFYDDALLLGRIVDLKLQFWGSRPFVVTYQKMLKFFIEKLLTLGYKTITVEQTENYYTKTDNICKREIVEMLSAGIMTDENFWKSSSDSKFLLCIIQKENKFGLTFVDCMTQTFFFDEVTKLEDLKSIVYRMKPVEIVSMKSYLEYNTMIFIKNILNPVFSQMKHFILPIEEIFEQLQIFFNERGLPDIIEELFKGFKKQKKMTKKKEEDDKEEEIPNFYLIQSLYLCFSYLKAMLTADSVFLYGNFSFFDLESLKSQKLYLDSTALRNLEIFDVNTESKLLNQHSLFNFLDRTKTGYGKRLLKRWFANPLRKIDEINDRLDAIEDLSNVSTLTDFFNSKIDKMPDFERALGRIYNSTNRQKLAFSTFDNFASNKLNEFIKLLEEFSKVEEIIETFQENHKKFKSRRLVKLTSFKIATKKGNFAENNSKNKKNPHNNQNINNLFPKITVLRKDIDEMIESSDGIIVPKPGTNEKFDEISKEIKGTQTKLNDILLQLKKKLKCSEFFYYHSKLKRYEIEIPDQFGPNMPSDYFLTSKKKGVLRYQSALIENYLQELESQETSLNEVLIPFFLKVFSKFYERQSEWLQVISCLAELDCLISLSKSMIDMGPYSTRPIFTDDGSFKLEQVYHPCLMDSVVNFIPNDINFTNETSLLLITGPNMGGKSTILRQACVSIILAQIGSYIPAKTLILKPFDRVFCRIGADDKILEGKSTFFMEMEESFNIVSEATESSFVIFDELGRGTSTYDGVALAYGVLKYLVENLKCKTMFSTHYHLLLDEFRLYKEVRNYYLDFKYNEENEEMDFLFKFVEGEACKSFGINVAKIVGVPKEVLAIAKEKAHSLNTELANLKGMKSINDQFNNCLRKLTLSE